MGIVQIIVVIAILLLLVKPAGTYLYHVFSNEPNKTDRIFGGVERGIFKLSGLHKREGMSWKTYALSFLTTNIVLVAFGYIVLRLQAGLPLNPNGITEMEQTLTFNTVISFITNTNLQHYSGETGLSYFSQMAVITMLMFTSAASGFFCSSRFCKRDYRQGVTGELL